MRLSLRGDGVAAAGVPLDWGLSFLILASTYSAAAHGVPKRALMNHIAPVINRLAMPVTCMPLEVFFRRSLYFGSRFLMPPAARKPSAAAPASTTGEASRCRPR